MNQPTKPDSIENLAARQPVAGSVDTPEFRRLAFTYAEAIMHGTVPATSKAWEALIAHINALIAPAAPSGEAVAYADPMAFLNFRTAACTKEWMWAKPDAGLVPLYTRPAPRDVDAPIVLPELAPSSPEEVAAFEAWAIEKKYDMTTHPLHWLFLNEKTYAARQGWKAGLAFARATAAVQKDRAALKGQTK